MVNVIVLPNLQVAMFGWPPVVKLSAREASAMAALHLGGIEAMRSPGRRVTCRTVDSLVAKGLLGRDGATPLGKAIAETCARNELPASA